MTTQPDTLTVRDLIERLSQEDPDALVMTRSSRFPSRPLNEVSTVSEGDVARCEERWFLWSK